MKNIGAHYLTNRIMSKKPPRHVYVKGNGKPGQTFDVDRFATLCEQYGLDPAEATLKLLNDAEQAEGLKAKEKLDAYIKLMEFLYSKKRSIEGEIDVEHTYVVSSEPLSDAEWENDYGVGTAEGATESTH